MFTSYWRLICISLLFPFSTSAEVSPDLPEDCGRLISGPPARDAIYVYCESLPQLTEEQALSLVIKVLNGTTRAAGEVRIFFFRDESVLHRNRWPADQGRLIDSWGGALVGAYHTQSQYLSVRTETDEGWREIYLPTARN